MPSQRTPTPPDQSDSGSTELTHRNQHHRPSLTPMDIGEFDPNYQQNMVEQNYELLVFDSRFDISEDLIDIDRRKVTWLGKKLRCAPRLSGLMISGMVAEHKGSLKRALKSLDDGWLYSLWWGAGFTNKFIFMFNVVALAAEIAFCILHSTSNNIFSPVTYLHGEPLIYLVLQIKPN